jgi:type I restriction enzyme M protein
MSEIADEKNSFNLNISRYVSTAEAEVEIDLAAVHASLLEIDKKVTAATKLHNEFLEQLRLPLLPSSGQDRSMGETQ